MEHRLRNRCELSMDVVVHGRDGLTLHGRTHDISPDGMFIRLPGEAVSDRKVVEIEISRDVWLHGWVVHVEDEGIGVMFHSIDGREERLLGQLLVERCVPKGRLSVA